MRQVKCRERHAVDFLGVQARLARRRRAPAPAEPDAAALAQRVDEADSETPRRRRALDGTDAVRNRDQAMRAAHTRSSHPAERRVAALMMPTSE